MPIRPENAKRYPKDWKTRIVPRIRERSGNRCECTGQCGRAHVVGANQPARRRGMRERWRAKAADRDLFKEK